MSSRKDVIQPYKVISAGSMAGNLTSAITNIQFMDSVCYQINILSGTPSGSFSVEGSLDYLLGTGGTVLNAGNWIDLGLTPAPTTTAGSPLNFILDLYALSFPWIRLVYTRTGGTGSMDAYVSCKTLS